MASSASQASNLLAYLIQGQEVAGLRFDGPQLLFTSGAGHPRGEPYINLASAWAVYPTRPASFPTTEDAVQELPGDSGGYLAAIELRRCIVEKVEVLEPRPHLVLTFVDGRVLFLWGGSEQYESWQAGLIAPGSETWLVVATPGGDLAIWAPADYREGAA